MNTTGISCSLMMQRGHCCIRNGYNDSRSHPNQLALARVGSVSPPEKRYWISGARGPNAEPRSACNNFGNADKNNLAKRDAVGRSANSTRLENLRWLVRPNGDSGQAAVPTAIVVMKIAPPHVVVMLRVGESILN